MRLTFCRGPGACFRWLRPSQWPRDRRPDEPPPAGPDGN